MSARLFARPYYRERLTEREKDREREREREKETKQKRDAATILMYSLFTLARIHVFPIFKFEFPKDFSIRLTAETESAREREREVIEWEGG